MSADQFQGLDKVILDHDYLYMLLFNLIIRHDERLREDVVEAIRHILQSQAQSSGIPRRTAAIASRARFAAEARPSKTC
jgi:hypothetical protein